MGQSQMKMWNVKKYGDTGVAKTQHTPSSDESLYRSPKMSVALRPT